MKLGTIVASLVLLGTACAVLPDTPGEGTRTTAEAMKRATGNDHSTVDVSTVAPSLQPPARDVGVRSSGSPCGASRCEISDYCCNESCGICAPRGGLCFQRQCGPTPTMLSQCVVDAECRAISSYCDGCQCVPAGELDPDPSCHGPLVACILDPCRAKHPACVNGGCALVDD